MCANIGVDPLASNKGVWAQVLASLPCSPPLPPSSLTSVVGDMLKIATHTLMQLITHCRLSASPEDCLVVLQYIVYRKPGYDVQVLGFGNFYYELGVQIVEACLATRPLNGGLMEMKPLMRFVNVRAPCTHKPVLATYSVTVLRPYRRLCMLDPRSRKAGEGPAYL